MRREGIDDDTQRLHEENRAAWNEAAQAYASRIDETRSLEIGRRRRSAVRPGMFGAGQPEVSGRTRSPRPACPRERRRYSSPLSRRSSTPTLESVSRHREGGLEELQSSAVRSAHA
jgi:hypothetical protein